MARKKKTDTPDTSQAIELTGDAIERLVCPPGKQQAFLRDTKVPGLRVRVTRAGAKSFVFESKLKNRGTFRPTIGDVRNWSIEDARKKARTLAVLVDGGKDPRALARQQEAERATAQEAAAKKAAIESLTVGEAWAQYISERTPHWGEHHRRDHARLTRPGGVVAKRGTRGRGVTSAGPLHPFMAMRMIDLSEQVIDAWAILEGQERPTVARLALRLMRAFLTWAGSPKRFGHILTNNPARSPEARAALGPPQSKDDALLREQLPQWFSEVLKIRNRTTSAYIQAMLFTGARPGELLALKWSDINIGRRSMVIDDKVDGTGRREIPLTPYVGFLLDTLPRRGDWVFAGGRALSMDPANINRRARRGHVEATPDKPMSEPNDVLTKACISAGVEHVTLHGLRRSFGTLTEWLEVPAGVVAQLQGHKPSATVEKHYRVRPLDLLRVHAEYIEREFLAWGRVPVAPSLESTYSRRKLTLTCPHCGFDVPREQNFDKNTVAPLHLVGA